MPKAWKSVFRSKADQNTYLSAEQGVSEKFVFNARLSGEDRRVVVTDFDFADGDELIFRKFGRDAFTGIDDRNQLSVGRGGNDVRLDSYADIVELAAASDGVDLFTRGQTTILKVADADGNLTTLVLRGVSAPASGEAVTAPGDGQSAPPASQTPDAHEEDDATKVPSVTGGQNGPAPDPDQPVPVDVSEEPDQSGEPGDGPTSSGAEPVVDTRPGSEAEVPAERPTVPREDSAPVETADQNGPGVSDAPAAPINTLPPTNFEPADPAAGFTATFYVSANGSDSNLGTEASPFKTINHAINKAAPGAVIAVREGVYHQEVNVWKSGTAETPITITAYPGEDVVIDGSRSGPNKDLVTISGSHVVLEGFEIRDATRSGIALWEADNVKVSDNVIHDTVRGGIWVGGGREGTSHHNTIEGNVVYNTCLENSAKSWSEGWPRAIAIDVSTDSVVRGNVVFDNYGEGIGALSSSDILYEGNVVYDNYSVQFYFDNSQDITVRDNIIFQTGEAEFYRGGVAGIGILIANEYTEFQKASSGYYISGNTLAGVDVPKYDGSYGWGGGLSGSDLSDNTILTLSQVDQDWIFDLA